ncbi:MAG: PhzF family phenazine biosynthesis protein [Bacillota bacterium]|nr:PhzF family phenazine biosynthesis protein [Bacillota bacterium]
MKSISFYIVDVFGEERYQGNQLAVFRNAGELSKIEMQRIAKETNFAETTFILSNSKTDNGYDVKIFTPDFEVPFAGHPTLGTAFIIHREIENGLPEKIRLNLGVGQIPVSFGQNSDIWMRQNPPKFSHIIDLKTISEILEIEKEDIDASFPIQEVSTGLPSIIVPLNSLLSVRKCHINHDKYKKFLDENFSANILVFCKETYNYENTLNVRVFCEDSGFVEDAATGSANGNLAGYLLEYNYFNDDQLQYSVEQGYEINRKSLLKVKASKIKNHFEITVGGKVFLIAKGEWFIA